ncbi:hypothetical protein B0H11DRAFT_1905263 [Mycena galericulata]|nr:hypothetical protein B0H11DRAFT_1905263 [Mycena galericulata]
MIEETLPPCGKLAPRDPEAAAPSPGVKVDTNRPTPGPLGGQMQRQSPGSHEQEGKGIGEEPGATQGRHSRCKAQVLRDPRALGVTLKTIVGTGAGEQEAPKGAPEVAEPEGLKHHKY